MRDENKTLEKIRFTKVKFNSRNSITIDYEYTNDFKDMTAEDCKKELKEVFFKKFDNDELFEGEIISYVHYVLQEITITASKADLCTLIYMLSENKEYQLI